MYCYFCSNICLSIVLNVLMNSPSTLMFILSTSQLKKCLHSMSVVIASCLKPMASFPPAFEKVWNPRRRLTRWVSIESSAQHTMPNNLRRFVSDAAVP